MLICLGGADDAAGHAAYFGSLAAFLEAVPDPAETDGAIKLAADRAKQLRLQPPPPSEG